MVLATTFLFGNVRDRPPTVVADRVPARRLYFFHVAVLAVLLLRVQPRARRATLRAALGAGGRRAARLRHAALHHRRRQAGFELLQPVSEIQEVLAADDGTSPIAVAHEMARAQRHADRRLRAAARLSVVAAGAGASRTPPPSARGPRRFDAGVLIVMCPGCSAPRPRLTSSGRDNDGGASRSRSAGRGRRMARPPARRPRRRALTSPRMSGISSLREGSWALAHATALGRFSFPLTSHPELPRRRSGATRPDDAAEWAARGG